MSDGCTQFKFAQRRVALDIVNGAEQIGSNVPVRRRFFQAGDIVFNLWCPIAQYIGKLF